MKILILVFAIFVINSGLSILQVSQSGIDQANNSKSKWVNCMFVSLNLLQNILI